MAGLLGTRQLDLVQVVCPARAARMGNTFSPAELETSKAVFDILTAHQAENSGRSQSLPGVQLMAPRFAHLLEVEDRIAAGGEEGWGACSVLWANWRISSE